MPKQPLHLRDVSTHRDGLHKILEQADRDGLTPSQTATLLAENGFGFAFSFPVKYGPTQPKWFTRNYVEGDLIVKMSKLKRKGDGTQRATVTELWRAERFWMDTNNHERVDAINVRTGRKALYAYAGHFEKVELDD